MATSQQQFETMAQMHRDEMAALAKMMHNNKPPAPDFTKFITPLLIAICVYYVTGTLKQSDSSAISVPVITEKLSSIQASIMKLEAQWLNTQNESKGTFKGLEDRVRHLEMSIFKGEISK